MGFLDKVRRSSFMRGNEDEYDDDDEYEDEYDDEEDEYEDEENEFEEEEYFGSAKAGNSYSAPSASASKRASYTSAPKSDKSTSNRVLNIHATAQLQVVIRKPETLQDATDVVDHLLERHTVVLNLESTTKEQARRIIDFLYGVTYAINGQISRVANATFVITPYNVGLIGQDVLGELENSGVFF